MSHSSSLLNLKDSAQSLKSDTVLEMGSLVDSQQKLLSTCKTSPRKIYLGSKFT